MGWEIHPPRKGASSKTPPLTVLVQLGQRTITAMLDTGSSVSLVRAHLIPASYPTIKYTEITGVYRKVRRWPVVRVPLTYNNKLQQVEVLKVDDLPFPLLLGRDAPDFGDLMRAALLHVTALSKEVDDRDGGRAI